MERKSREGGGTRKRSSETTRKYSQTRQAKNRRDEKAWNSILTC